MQNELIRFDWAMKRLLRDKSNYVVLEGFLSTLLGEDLHISRFLESESNQTSKDDKFNRVDILAEDAQGRLLIIEVQNNRELYYFHRILYGVSKTISEYINLGNDYDKVRKIYSINEGNYVNFPVGVKKYIKYCQEKDEATHRPYTSRYIGSLVADYHRNMLKGGIYIYPETGSHPTGKLRLLYECNPIAFIAEQSGALAVDGERRIMEIQPEALHQRVPLYVGSRNMVLKVQEFLNFFNHI